ncbi:MAG: hydroxymethylbilane synthase [Bacteroidetes bacterium]|nr:hydroxymethylbilane synthase [Bacteroidota bacterium]
MTQQLRVGTRRSPLARTQTNEVVQRLKVIFPQLDIVILGFTSIGDQTKGPLPTSTPGIFTSTLDAALINGDIDFAIHSLKDLPTARPEELTIAAIPKRKSAFDVLVTVSGQKIDDLPQGATVNTSSLRRTAQLLATRSDLKIEPLRGNVDSRVKKIIRGELQAIVLAEAGLSRLEISSVYQQRIPMDFMLPAPAQGALAVECRRSDPNIVHILESIDCPSTRATTTAERTFLASTQGGCAIPIGAYAEYINDEIHLSAEVLSVDGSKRIIVSGVGLDATELGYQLAQKAYQMGAKKILNRA